MSANMAALTFQAFLSTPSARRATPVRLQRPQSPYISIHALREEGDRYTPRFLV